MKEINPIGYAFTIPGFGLSKTFETEEEAIMRRMDVSEALAIPVDHMAILWIPGPDDAAVLV